MSSLWPQDVGDRRHDLPLQPHPAVDLVCRDLVPHLAGKTVVPVTHLVTHPRKHQPNGPACEPTADVTDIAVGFTGVVETGPDPARPTT